MFTNGQHPTTNLLAIGSCLASLYCITSSQTCIVQIQVSRWTRSVCSVKIFPLIIISILFLKITTNSNTLRRQPVLNIQCFYLVQMVVMLETAFFWSKGGFWTSYNCGQIS